MSLTDPKHSKIKRKNAQFECEGMKLKVSIENLEETREVSKLPNSRPTYKYYQLSYPKKVLEIFSQNIKNNEMVKNIPKRWKFLCQY